MINVDESDIKLFNESITAAMTPERDRLIASLPAATAAMKALNAETSEPKNKGGRPKGFDGTRSRMPSALAQHFKKAGLEWQLDFALAIKTNDRERIQLWLKLLPYMITTCRRGKLKKWKGKPSKAARIALEAMENDLR